MTLIDQDTPIDIYIDDTVKGIPVDSDSMLDSDILLNFGAGIETMCDMQPYSGELAQEEYGLEIECVKRIYTEQNKIISEGVKIADRGQKPVYIVKYKEHWKDYTMALLCLIPQALQDNSVDNGSGTNSASDIYGGGFY